MRPRRSATIGCATSTKSCPCRRSARRCRRLVEWTSDYYLAPPGAVLRMVLPGVAFADARRPIVEYRATGELPARMTPQRTVALEKIGTRQGMVRELAALADVSDAVIRGLVNTRALEAVTVSADQPYPEPDSGFAPPDLSDEQTAAAAQLKDAVAAAKFDTLLLDGVTGSGKTEVYMEAIAAAIDAGKQALVLLPEIALTEPMLTRFAARSGCEPVARHSGLRSTERRRARHSIAAGEAKIVVGARSALFLALCRPRRHRRRRGARDELQAGGWRPLSRARRRGDARAFRRAAGDPRERDPPRSRASRWSRRGAIAISGFPRASAARPCPISRRSTCGRTRPTAAAGLRRRSSTRSPTGSTRASKACSSSTAAASRR